MMLYQYMKLLNSTAWSETMKPWEISYVLDVLSTKLLRLIMII